MTLAHFVRIGYGSRKKMSSLKGPTTKRGGGTKEKQLFFEA